MAIVTDISPEELSGRPELDPRTKHRLSIEAMLAAVAQGELGGAMTSLWQRFASKARPLDEKRPVHHSGELIPAHLKGSRLTLSSPVMSDLPDKDRIFTVAKLNVYALQADGATDGELLASDFSAVYFSVKASVALFHGSVHFRHDLHQGVALRLHDEEAAYTVTAHPYRNLADRFPWREPDYQIAGAVSLPIDSDTVALAADVVEKATLPEAA